LTSGRSSSVREKGAVSPNGKTWKSQVIQRERITGIDVGNFGFTSFKVKVGENKKL
jgi:hypothetical protein